VIVSWSVADVGLWKELTGGQLLAEINENFLWLGVLYDALNITSGIHRGIQQFSIAWIYADRDRWISSDRRLGECYVHKIPIHDTGLCFRLDLIEMREE
jgi:hypothetical protein